MMFSIVIPLYNKGAKIKKTIESVLSQSFSGYEIIIIDDGSTDDSRIYVQTFDDSRIKYYRKENGGVSSARNYGVEKATSDWIVFLDADDDLMENALFVYKELIEKYPKVRVFATRQDCKYCSDGFFNRIFYFFFPSYSTRFPYFYYWSRIFFASPGTLCFNKELFSDSVKFDERHSFYEDLEFLLKLMSNKSVAFSKEHIMRYNQDNSGLSLGKHNIEKEMAFHISEYVQSCGFWKKAIIYENIEESKNNWTDDELNYSYYNNLQNKYFHIYYNGLHWLRQHLIKYKII